MADENKKNFLSPLNFKFIIKRAPNLNFFVQAVNVPSLSLGSIEVNNPNLRVPYGDVHLMYDELKLTYAVDENLANFMELHKWLRSLGKRTFKEYEDLKDKKIFTGESLRSDISLSILTSHRNPNFEIVFRDSIPIYVGGLNFDTRENDVNYIVSQAIFRYVDYEIFKY